jgi:hypothetical protein
MRKMYLGTNHQHCEESFMSKQRTAHLHKDMHIEVDEKADGDDQPEETDSIKIHAEKLEKACSVRETRTKLEQFLNCLSSKKLCHNNVPIMSEYRTAMIGNMYNVAVQ